MKHLITLAVLSLSLFSCKKEKDEYIPTSVETKYLTLSYKDNLDFNNEYWFCAEGLKSMTMQQVSLDPGLQEKVLFGYYHNDTEYGLYSAPVYPIQFGQGNWETQRSVTFKKAKITGYELFELKDANPNGIPVEVILDGWNNGINPRSKIAYPQEGEVFAFRTDDGKMKGLIVIMAVASNFSHCNLDVTLAK